MGDKLVNVLNEEALNKVREQYGPGAWEKTVRLEFESSRYFNRVKNLVEQDRFGEVVFAVERPNKKFIAVRSKEYPEGIFRIPTGGISHGEDIVRAVEREVLEELGLETVIHKFLGLYRTQISNGSRHIWFYSFFFHLRETGGVLLANATDDEVSEVRESDADELARLTGLLANMGRNWRDWGAFRSLTTGAVAEYVKGLNNA